MGKYVKGSFLVVPNKEVFRGAEPYVQSVYFWICNYADSNGICFPSRTTIAFDAGCSVKSVDRALELLVIAELLIKQTRKDGEKNLTNIYQIALVDGGGSVPQSLPSVPQSLGVASEGRTELNPVLTQSTERLVYTSESKDSREFVITKEEEKPQRERKDTTYRGVFALWERQPKGWLQQKPQIQAAKNLLEEHGLEGVKKALAFAAKFKDDPYCPSVTSPYDLDSKWGKLLAYKQKHS